MCGIAGIVRFGEKPIEESALALLLLGNEERGGDATGIALSQDDGSIDILKKDVRAWQFVRLKDYTEFIQEKLKPTTWAALLHTRFASVGDPQNNVNNHPVCNGRAAIIHNGGIRNDVQIFNQLQLVRTAEVDSDIIRAIVDKYGISEMAVKMANKLDGSAAGAAFHPDYPHKMLLFKSGSPMALGSDKDFFYFSSKKEPMYAAMRPYVERWKNMWFQVERADASFAPMAEHTAWIIGDEGQEGHFEFKTMNGQYLDPCRPVHTKFEDRFATKKDHWSKTKNISSGSCPKGTQEAVCPNCGHIWLVPEGVTDFSTFNCSPAEEGKQDAKEGCGHKGLEPIVSRQARVN